MEDGWTGWLAASIAGWLVSFHFQLVSFHFRSISFHFELNSFHFYLEGWRDGRTGRMEGWREVWMNAGMDGQALRLSAASMTAYLFSFHFQLASFHFQLISFHSQSISFHFK